MTPINEIETISASDLIGALPYLYDKAVITVHKQPRFVVLPVHEYEQMIKGTSEQKHKCANVRKCGGCRNDV